MARKRVSKEDCQAFLDRFHNSKLTVARFCENEYISIATFYKRRKRAESSQKKHRQQESPTRFVPLHTAGFPKTYSQDSFSIELFSGAVLKIPMQFDSESAASLIGILKELSL